MAVGQPALKPGRGYTERPSGPTQRCRARHETKTGATKPVQVRSSAGTPGRCTSQKTVPIRAISRNALVPENGTVFHQVLKR